jgi:hypothetical protein
VPATAFSFRLAPASMKKGTLVKGMTAPSRWCSSSRSFSALVCRRFVATSPTTTHASNGSHCRGAQGGCVSERNIQEGEEEV